MTEEIKNLQKVFWMSMGMTSTVAPEGTDLTEMITFIDKMFEEKLK